jgi:aldehyde:ferredoxin oxidoreductase
VEWSYGSILGDRDINEHCINMAAYWIPTIAAMVGEEPFVSAETLVDIMSKKLLPYQDPAMLDYSPEGIYADGKVKMIAWHRHYSRFWKQSMLFCDIVFPSFLNINAANKEGYSPEAEPRFFNAVTGKNLTFEDGMEIGRKIWNLDRSVWVLQGRHRDQEVFPEYVYSKPIEKPTVLPAKENGKWAYVDAKGRTLDREKFEHWKTKFFKFEGWDSKTGWPTENTLTSLGLNSVAAELKEENKLVKG